MFGDIVQTLAERLLIDLRIQMHVSRNDTLIAQREEVADHGVDLRIQDTGIEMLLWLELVRGDLDTVWSGLFGLWLKIDIADLLGRQGDGCQVVGQCCVVVYAAATVVETADAAARLVVVDVVHSLGDLRVVRGTG